MHVLIRACERANLADRTRARDLDAFVDRYRDHRPRVLAALGTFGFARVMMASSGPLINEERG